MYVILVRTVAHINQRLSTDQGRRILLPKLVIRPKGPENLRKQCGVTLDRDLGDQIGIHRAQVSRVLSGKHDAGNRFIAGVIDRCGLEFTFTKVFAVAQDDDQ